jgi:hypothetical protein
MVAGRLGREVRRRRGGLGTGLGAQRAAPWWRAWEREGERGRVGPVCKIEEGEKEEGGGGCWLGQGRGATNVSRNLPRY